ncbi:MAG TPA: hypothetical protein VMU18_04585 [Rhodoblastus sp.]|nr:hypothetical protein [Rhodoblastus sp.]
MTAEQDIPPVDPTPANEASSSPAVAQAMHAVQKAMEDLAALLGADSTATLDALKQAGQAASDNLVGIADDARDIGRAGLDELSASVRRNPLAWLAGAVGLGLIVGLWRNRAERS